MTNPVTVNIERGPSNMDLMFSLFDDNPDSTCRLVHFVILGSGSLTFVKIEGLKKEEPNWWCFQGWIFEEKARIRPVSGVYSSQTRTGQMELHPSFEEAFVRSVVGTGP